MLGLSKVKNFFGGIASLVETRRPYVDLYEAEVEVLTSSYNKRYWEELEKKCVERVGYLKASIEKEERDREVDNGVLQTE